MTEVSTHRTTEVPIAITCPSWCQIEAWDHAADLWEFDGRCIHSTPENTIYDQEGFHAYRRTWFADPIRVQLVAETDPNGREVTSPALRIDDEEYGLDQALVLADEIRRQVALYRSTGGAA